MSWIANNLNAIGAFALLIFSFAFFTWLYKAFANPLVRIIELNAINVHVHLLIMHNLDKLHVHLEDKTHQFEFEGLTYYWSPIQRHTNEVYNLCIDRKGKMHELLRVDFTQKDVKIHSYG